MYVEFLRHGLPHGDKCLRGITDFALSEIGFEQMQRAWGADETSARNLPDLIISSPLKRCHRFALWLAEKEGIKLVEDVRWQEMDFGIWDGMKLADVYAKYPKEAEAFWHDPLSHNIPQAERYTDFMLRIHTAWETLLDEHYSEDKKILVVTHSGVIRQVIHSILQLPQTSLAHIYQLNLPYAARVRINITRDKIGCYWPQIQWPSSHSL